MNRIRQFLTLLLVSTGLLGVSNNAGAAIGTDDYDGRDAVCVGAQAYGGCASSTWRKNGTTTSGRGYVWRNCTDFAAFRANQLAGRRVVPSGWGHARTWDDRARAIGIPVDGSPRVGDIAQTDAGGGGFGHVAIVAEVGTGANAGKIRIEEYNWVVKTVGGISYFDGRYHNNRWLATSKYRYIHVQPKGGSPGDIRDLAFVKWAPTGSGRIEVHTATTASRYAQFGIHAATPIAAGDTNGVFDMADVNGDGRADLVYIKRRNTGSGRIEVHWANAATGYGSYGGNLATVLSAADDPNGAFELADMNGDRRADLVFTKTRNTGSGRVELHWADAASGYARFGAHQATAFSTADAGNGYFHPADMNADGRVDLGFVKIRNTGSGRIEVHWANAATGYGAFGGHHATALSGGERTNGWFETVDMNGDRAADLVFLKDHNVGSGKIELHWLDARAGFSRVTFSAATAFSAAEAGHGFFTVM
jgi:surface antigen